MSNMSEKMMKNSGVIKEEQDKDSGFDLNTPAFNGSMSDQIAGIGEHKFSSSRHQQANNYDNPSYVELILKCEKMESEEEYPANYGSRDELIDYDNPTTTDFMRSVSQKIARFEEQRSDSSRYQQANNYDNPKHVELLLKCEKMGNEILYDANNGSHNQTIDHDSMTTLGFTRGLVKEELDDGGSYDGDFICPLVDSIVSQLIASMLEDCDKLRLENERQLTDCFSEWGKVLEEMNYWGRFTPQSWTYLNNTSQLGLRSNGTPLQRGLFMWNDYLESWEPCPKHWREADRQKDGYTLAELTWRGKEERGHGGSFRDALMDFMSPPVFRNSENKKNVTETRPLKLQFTNNISLQVHTGMPIKGEDGQPLFISLVDSQSGELVTSIHEASARVEIVVLNADFGEDCFSREVFKSKTVLREGNNRALLTGNVIVDLKEGIACLSTVRFSQSKIWRKMCDYRLGAIALDDDMGVNIKEGVTDSFIVKDGRLKDNKKHYSLPLDSEMWRLAKIAKDGPFNQSLNFAKIYTVGDFLKELKSNPQKLRYVFGRLMHSGPWEELKAHAKTLEVDGNDSWSYEVFKSVTVRKEGNKPLTENVTYEELKAHAKTVEVDSNDSWTHEVLKNVTYEEIEAHAKTLEVDGNDSWTHEVFKSTTVREEGNKPLLTENVTVYLNKSIGFLGTDGFPRTRIYKRKCADMLGGIVTDDDDMNFLIAHSLLVKNANLTYDMNHCLPTLSSEVWRLDNIAKNGDFHRRLSDININTLEDFLKELNTDPQKQRYISGKGMSCRKWAALVTHALTCNVNDSQKSSIIATSSGSEIKNSPIMNDDFAQPAFCFNSKDSSVDNQSQGNGLPSMVVSFASQDLPFKKVCRGPVA